ncbi:MAG: hypothetical protein V7641_1581 [Blastocatellia bacterium]
MKMKNAVNRLFALFVSIALLSPLFALRAEAGDNKGNKDRVIIHIGAPAVWSLGQAHYLLAKMQKNNLQLETNTPGKEALDPNAINATKIQILRTLLDVEAQFSEKIGAENRAELDAFKDKLKRREEQRTELRRKQAELDDLDTELRTLRQRQARMQKELEQIQTERKRPKPDPQDPSKTLPTPPPSADENELEQDLAAMGQKINEKQKERDKVKGEVDELEKQANTDVAGPKLSEVQLGNGASLPSATKSISDRIDKVITNMNDPRFAASIVLDNFIGMQYEIIAKQLTLLRDEVGPDERIVFLELPSSIYTVACKGDEYIAQVQWAVTEYYDDPDIHEATEDRETTMNKAARLAEAFRQSNLKSDSNRTDDPDKKKPEGEPVTVQLNHLTENEQNYIGRQDYIALRNRKIALIKNQQAVKSIDPRDANWTTADSSTVRAVDVIPRQSALNVNEVQSTTSQKNFLGVMKLLIGLGVRVNYQRQQELYEQYLQQEVFASGFGKGRNAFGWTFGPLPGTDRISPGVRTTFAALVIPRSASLLRLEARGVAFHRKEAPALEEPDLATGNDIPIYKNGSRHLVFKDDFAIIIPNETTEKFEVSSINYTPARKGEPVTVVVKGSYFSPQSGILVDGVPLVRSLSLGNTATSEAIKDPDGAGVRGQYEQVSSHEIVMKFSMPDNFAGTPNITLVTPEKSSALNFITLLINDHRPNTTLRDLVVTEPMFMPSFSLQTKFTDMRDDGSTGFKFALLRGTGLRRKAEVWVNGEELKLFRKTESQMKLLRDYTPRRTLDDLDLRELRRSIAYAYQQDICARLGGCTPEDSWRLFRQKELQLLDSNELYKAVKEMEIARLKNLPAAKPESQITQDIEDKYEKPQVPQYIIEQNVGEYQLRFKKTNPEKYAVRYGQNAINNYEASDFTQVEITEDATLMNYAPNYEKSVARVDVRFKVPDKAVVKAVEVSPSDKEDKAISLHAEGNNYYRALLNVKFDDLGNNTQVEKEKISVTVIYADGRLKTYDLSPPLRPRITKITLDQPTVADNDGPVVSVEGNNLKGIKKVKVGDKEADIVGWQSPNTLLIKLKGIEIKKDTPVQVPLVLEAEDGTKLTVIVTVGETKKKKEQSADQAPEKK